MTTIIRLPRIPVARRHHVAGWCCLVLLIAPLEARVSAAAERSVGAESVANWAYYSDVRQPLAVSVPWIDFVLPPAVFDEARYDLQDLRLYSGEREVPFALRVRVEKSIKDPYPADEFNRTEGPNGSSEISLDLNRSDIEHNRVEIGVPGINYRRQVELEGSDDGSTWRLVQQQPLVYFERGGEKLRDDSITYPPSRYRYLRARVHRDPLVDKDPVPVESIRVFRRLEIPGERLRLTAELGPRQPVRTDRGPGSAWVMTLGGRKTPVDRIELEVADSDFVRDYEIEVGGLPDSREPFVRIATGVWQRRAGDPIKPLVADFPETRAARVRVSVTDHRNPPLQVRNAAYSAPARQLVFAPLEPGQPLRLYFGYAKATEAAYDFARNLPERLEPEPARAELGARQENPVYVPEPLPLTERWPALIYAVLSAVILVLGGILVSLSRAAIRISDEQRAPQAEAMTTATQEEC